MRKQYKQNSHLNLLIAFQSSAADAPVELPSYAAAVQMDLPHLNLRLQTGELGCVRPGAVFHHEELELTAAVVIVGCLTPWPCYSTRIWR